MNCSQLRGKGIGQTLHEAVEFFRVVAANGDYEDDAGLWEVFGRIIRPSWRDVGRDCPPSLNRQRLSSIHETQHAPDFPIPASSALLRASFPLTDGKARRQATKERASRYATPRDSADFTTVLARLHARAH